jgi:hypothetical protein
MGRTDEMSVVGQVDLKRHRFPRSEAARAEREHRAHRSGLRRDGQRSVASEVMAEEVLADAAAGWEDHQEENQRADGEASTEGRGAHGAIMPGSSARKVPSAMAYDEALAERVRRVLSGVRPVTEQEMFGQLAFMVAGNVCCRIVGPELVVHVDPTLYHDALTRPHAHETGSSGRAARGVVYVDHDGLTEGPELDLWVRLGVARARSLPPKRPSKRKTVTATKTAASRNAPRTTKTPPAKKGGAAAKKGGAAAKKGGAAAKKAPAASKKAQKAATRTRPAR